jgi:hypothetical protein
MPFGWNVETGQKPPPPPKPSRFGRFRILYAALPIVIGVAIMKAVEPGGKRTRCVDALAGATELNRIKDVARTNPLALTQSDRQKEELRTLLKDVETRSK